MRSRSLGVCLDRFTTTLLACCCIASAGPRPALATSKKLVSQHRLSLAREHFRRVRARLDEQLTALQSADLPARLSALCVAGGLLLTLQPFRRALPDSCWQASAMWRVEREWAASLFVAFGEVAAEGGMTEGLRAAAELLATLDGLEAGQRAQIRALASKEVLDFVQRLTRLDASLAKLPVAISLRNLRALDGIRVGYDRAQQLLGDRRLPDLVAELAQNIEQRLTVALVHQFDLRNQPQVDELTWTALERSIAFVADSQAAVAEHKLLAAELLRRLRPPKTPGGQRPAAVVVPAY